MTVHLHSHKNIHFLLNIERRREIRRRLQGFPEKISGKGEPQV
jgi:hypothetical protein